MAVMANALSAPLLVLVLIECEIAMLRACMSLARATCISRSHSLSHHNPGAGGKGVLPKASLVFPPVVLWALRSSLPT